MRQSPTGAKGGIVVIIAGCMPDAVDVRSEEEVKARGCRKTAVIEMMWSSVETTESGSN